MGDGVIIVIVHRAGVRPPRELGIKSSLLCGKVSRADAKNVSGRFREPLTPVHYGWIKGRKWKRSNAIGC